MVCTPHSVKVQSGVSSDGKTHLMFAKTYININLKYYDYILEQKLKQCSSIKKIDFSAGVYTSPFSSSNDCSAVDSFLSVLKNYMCALR